MFLFENVGSQQDSEKIAQEKLIAIHEKPLHVRKTHFEFDRQNVKQISLLECEYCLGLFATLDENGECRSCRQRSPDPPLEEIWEMARKIREERFAKLKKLNNAENFFDEDF
jgi:urease accessory protein UreH